MSRDETMGAAFFISQVNPADSSRLMSAANSGSASGPGDLTVVSKEESESHLDKTLPMILRDGMRRPDAAGCDMLPITKETDHEEA
jgi:hypothetical protein